MSEEHVHDDHGSAREAFQFLVLGAGAVILLRLLIVLVRSLLLDPGTDGLAEATMPFREVYPLVNDHTVVVEHLETMPRIAVGFLFALTAGLVGAMLLVPVGILTRWTPMRAVVAGGRAGLALGAAWALWCLSAFPAHHVEFTGSGAVRHESTAFLGTIALPFGEEETTIPAAAINGFASVAMMKSRPCGEVQEVRMLLGSGPVAIAMAPLPPANCETASAEQKANSERLVKALENWLKSTGQNRPE